MPSPSTKERKAKFNTDDLIFRKKSNLSGYFDIEYNSAELLTKTSPEQIVNRILSGRTWIIDVMLELLVQITLNLIVLMQIKN